MLMNFVTWCFIFWFALCIGTLCEKGWKKLSGQSIASLDMVLMLGICAINVYAQFFSIFYKVGEVANVILLAACIVITCVLRKDIISLFCIRKKKKWYFYLFVVVIVLMMLAVGSCKPSFYDTKLYHGQAIRWIEEYGVVKGLGVLHNRLAYNSAFMCLQALFGYRYIFDVELHSVNAFLAAIFLIWGLGTLKIWSKKRIGASDTFKVLLIFFICIMGKENISSPNTDFFALALIIYAIGKWTELIEVRNRNAASYTQLCFLFVYGVTLKLSVAAVVVLAIYPIYLLIKEKKYKLMGCSVLIGLIILCPFLIRNVIISGYLVYPYAQIDFFDVDWKMPSSQVNFDKEEIIVWGRKLKDTAKFDWSLREWFPVWYAELTTLYKIIFAMAVGSIPVAVIRSIWIMVKKHELIEKLCMSILYVVEIIALAMWFFSSPDVRYGAVFMLLVPITLLGELFYQINKKELSAALIGIATIPLMISMILYVADIKKYYIVPAEYKTFEVNECQIDSITFYYPADHDWTGYYNFPGITYVNRVSLIELRGDSLEEGFRMKDRYVNIDTYGNIIQE